MKTKDAVTPLIEKLCLELTPVRRINWSRILGVHFILFSVLAFLWIFFVGARPDFRAQVSDSEFQLQSVVLAVLVLIGSYFVSRSSIPGGGAGETLAKIFIFALLSLWITVVALSIQKTTLNLPMISQNFSFACFFGILAATGVSSFLSYFVIRRAAPTNLAFTGLIAASVSAAFGALLYQFICPICEPLHLLSSHLPPVLLASFLGYFAGLVFLRW